MIERRRALWWILPIVIFAGVGMWWLDPLGESAIGEHTDAEAESVATQGTQNSDREPTRRESISSSAPIESVDPSTDARTSITGRILAARTGEPVSNATIEDTIHPDKTSARFTSDTNGEFHALCTFDDEESTGVLRVTKKGFLPRNASFTSDWIGPDGIDGVVVELWPQSQGAILTGRIVDPGGRAVRGAKVRAFELRADRKLRRPVDHVGVLDDRGKFEVRVSPGIYELVITCDGYANHRATALSVRAAGTIDIGTVTLTPRRVTTLQGIVWNNGVPCRGAKVRVATGIDRKRTTSGAGGEFRIQGILPGRRSLAVEWQSIRYYAMVNCEADVTTNHDVRLVTGDHYLGGIVVERTGVEGSGAGERPLAGIDVECVTVDLNREDLYWSTRTDAQGRFRIDHLPSSRVNVHVSRDHPLDSLEVEGVDVDRIDHRFVLPGPPPKSRIHGSVRDPDGNAVVGAVLSTMQHRSIAARAMTDAEGNYSLEVQPERDQSLLLTCHKPGFISQRQYLDRGLVESGEMELPIVLDPIDATGEVAGRITDVGGGAVREADVIIAARRGRVRTVWRLATDFDGRFLQRGVTAQELQIVVRHPDYIEDDHTTSLGAGSRIDHDVSLKPRVRLTRRVEVRLPDDLPAHGATVSVWWVGGHFIDGGLTEQGVCRLDRVPDQPVTVTCEMKGYPAIRAQHRFPAEAGEPLRLRLRAGKGTLRGRTRGPEGKIRTGVELQLTETGEGTRVWAIEYSDAKGEYSFERLPAGSYELKFYPGPVTVPVEIGAGETVLPVRIG